ncbi:MAG: potassium channel family protein [Gemmatimonadetes bacterium]|nr:potassium channel family protein [Gemmatimonadota bacterium]
MTGRPVLIFGAGHLAVRIRKLATANGDAVTSLTHATIHPGHAESSAMDAIGRALRDVDVDALSAVFLVDDRDEHNLEMLLALISTASTLPIVASLFNENVAPHLQAAHPNLRILNPAKLAAAAFVEALDTPLTRTLRYVPAPMAEDPAPRRVDRTIPRLLAGFVALVATAVAYFHLADGLGWLDALYFVVVTTATVGYGDINLLNASAFSKIVGIALILASTCFIWMIFSLTVDRIIKRQEQMALGRKRYDLRDHVILCGLGRLGYFIAEGLLRRGEQVMIIEANESLSTLDHLRSMGATVYVGDARLARVLRDVGVTRAKALFSVINNDFVNLEVGLNARSFAPGLRLIVRVFDDSMSRLMKDHLDIHLTLSMSAIADQLIFDAVPREG